MKVILLSLLAFMIAASACNKGVVFPAEDEGVDSTMGRVTINDFSPEVFYEGDTVVIHGVNFSEDVEVWFGNADNKTQGTVLQVSNKLLMVAAPGGLNRSGKVHVRSKGITAESRLMYIAGQWWQVGEFPDSMRAYGFSFAIGGKVYFGGGESVPPFTAQFTTYSRKLYAYDTLAGTWEMKKDFPGAGRSNASVFVINGKAYVGNGGVVSYSSTGSVTARTNFRDFYEYNPDTDTWHRIADMPAGSERLDACGFAINGIGYIGMGLRESGPFSTVFLDDFYKYSPLTNTWMKLPVTFPVIGTVGREKRRGVTCFVLNGKAIIGGGGANNTNSNSGLADFQRFDPVALTFTPVAAHPERYYYRIGGFGFAIGGKGYIGGGSIFNITQSFTLQRVVYAFEDATNTWTTLPVMPQAAFNAMGTNVPSPIPHNGGAGYGAATENAAYYLGKSNRLWKFQP
ncbi:Kelch repeat-containing protein [Chitinophaga barathri]|nr:IPT/TIG domain-containing protein [Chitinophaga barathri]